MTMNEEQAIDFIRNTEWKGNDYRSPAIDESITMESDLIGWSLKTIQGIKKQINDLREAGSSGGRVHYMVGTPDGDGIILNNVVVNP